MRYKSIGDTIVQLFPLQITGLIATVPCVRLSELREATFVEFVKEMSSWPCKAC
jgi:hypothetical protein